VEDLLYTKKCLTQKLKRLQMRYNRLKEQLQIEKEKKNSEWKCMDKIEVDANNMNPRALFILDQINNYQKKVPRWSETIAWRYCSPKGYEFPRNVFFRLPCKSTLKKLVTENSISIREILTLLHIPIFMMDA
jgi:hypothetical protein